MRKCLLVLVPLLAVLVLAPVARAEDLIPPPWDLPVPDDRGTWQDWEFYTDEMVDVEADFYENPFGTPLLTMEEGLWEGWGLEDSPSWDGTLTSWHVGGDQPGKHSIQIHNTPADGIRKEVWIQVTSTGAPISVGGQPGHGATTTPGGDPLPLGTDPTGATWSVYPYLVTFPDNPTMEYIEIWFEPCTWVEEIVIHTRCVPVPEPSLMALFGVAGLLFLRKRKNK